MVVLDATIRDAIDAGDKRSGSTSPWAKIKFDRQMTLADKRLSSMAKHQKGGLQPGFRFQVPIEVPPGTAKLGESGWFTRLDNGISRCFIGGPSRI
jgi:hypothetical protein